MNYLIELTILFFAILLIGYYLSSLVYKNKHKTFKGSQLQLKVLMWLPIYSIFIVYVLSGIYIQLAIIISVVLGILLDVRDHYAIIHSKILTACFVCLVILGVISAQNLFNYNSELLIALVFSSVLSDVFAFFFGNFAGKHKLPKILNKNKSWEGVAGQFIGALFGIIILNYFIFPVAIAWFLVVGVGSAIGDLMNSYIKRKEEFKDWSNRVPGHGGFIDRFSSLSMVLLLSLLITRIYS